MRIVSQVVAAERVLHLWYLETKCFINEMLILTTERSFFMVSGLQNVWYSWLGMEIMAIAWKYSHADRVTFLVEEMLKY